MNSALDDVDLVRAAQRGERDAFAVLYSRHRAGMRAVATGLLGADPEAEDVCQDAAITGLARIGELRDPASVRPWLHTIVRNNCRTLLRGRRPVPVGVAGLELAGLELPGLELAAESDGPLDALERSAQRDWVWHAIGRLTPATQTVAMLRYFTRRNSYEEIALACGTPVGTVRSRLSEARRQLADALLRVRDDRHPDAGALVTRRREEAEFILASMSNNVPLSVAHERWSPGLVWHWPKPHTPRTVGFDYLFGVFAIDHDLNTTYRVREVIAGDGVTIWTADFVFAPDFPFDRPPSGVWLLRERQGRVVECRFSYTTSAFDAGG